MFFTNRISTTAFNISVQPERFVLGFAPRAGQKDKDTNFVFDPFLLEQTRLWWETADSEPLCLNGPTGCGKTSFIREFLLRVSAPFVELTCHRRLDKSALLGGFVPTQKGFEWQDGPAARAWREGLVLVINEFSIAPPEVWVAANDILEGGDLYLPQTGETIRRHPNARVVITDNMALGADAGDGYLGRESQDLSTVDRFWHIRCQYPAKELELDVVRRKTDDAAVTIPKQDVDCLLKGAIDFAALSRQKADSGIPSISTRVLIRLVRILFGWAQSRVKTIPIETIALDLAIANALNDESRKQLALLAEGTLNAAIDKVRRHF